MTTHPLEDTAQIRANWFENFKTMQQRGPLPPKQKLGRWSPLSLTIWFPTSMKRRYRRAQTRAVVNGTELELQGEGEEESLFPAPTKT